jgi:hypothetical protein
MPKTLAHEPLPDSVQPQPLALVPLVAVVPVEPVVAESLPVVPESVPVVPESVPDEPVELLAVEPEPLVEPLVPVELALLVESLPVVPVVPELELDESVPVVPVVPVLELLASVPVVPVLDELLELELELLELELEDELVDAVVAPTTWTAAWPSMKSTVPVTAPGKSPLTTPAVKSPVASMVPASGSTAHATAWPETGLPNESAAAAVKRCCAPESSVGWLGEMLTDTTGPAVTTTVAVAVRPCAAASTVSTYVPGVAPAVKMPVDGSIDPPPWMSVQTGVTATVLPFTSVPVAWKATVPPARVDAVGGLTLSCDSAAWLMVTSAVPVTAPTLATTAAG